ncbi:MAG: hypothetical protein MZV64_63780 [Ignavibacteriales bacterium]|nr:hypothetical protein [Ignavibacteriales bacterium]
MRIRRRSFRRDHEETDDRGSRSRPARPHPRPGFLHRGSDAADRRSEGPGAPQEDPDRRHPLRHGRSACSGRTGRSASATTRRCAACGKIDLPRMKEGGLDAEFFAAFVGQGPLTPEAYAKAKDSALKAVAAVRQDDGRVRPADRAGRRPWPAPGASRKRAGSRPSSAWRTAIPSAGTCRSSRPSTTRASATSPSAIPPTTTSATPRPTAATPRTRA